MSLQEALRLMRLELGMTQTDLAQKMGKSFVTVNKWENGKGFPSRENAKKILQMAEDCQVSGECYSYLCDTLIPDIKRSKIAAPYGFPEIDRDFLIQIADGSTNSLYVIEAGTYNLLYANRAAENTAIKHLLGAGKILNMEEHRLLKQKDRRCFCFFDQRTSPCPFCPLGQLRQDAYSDEIISIPETGKVFRIHATATKMKTRDVYIIQLTDITERSAERLSLYEMTNDIHDGVGIYHVYYDGRIALAFMNEALYKMIGAEKRDALMENGETDLSLIHWEDRGRLRGEISAAIAKRRNIDLVMRMRTKADAYTSVHLTGRQIKKDTEKITFYCLFCSAGKT